MSDKPVITIVLPVYNGERYLSEALNAILAQSYADFELIIVDDCSTDATPAILNDYALRDSRIRIIRNETNLKLPASLNVGHRAGRGTLFTWTSDDNNPHPDWLETLANALVQGNADIVYSRYAGMDETGVLLDSGSDLPPLSQLLWQNTIGASFLYTREVFETLQGYDPSLFLVEDYDFWVRAYLHRFHFLKIDDCLYDYRHHNKSLSYSLPQSGINIPYRVRIRKLFNNASPEEIFKSRTTLLFNGRKVLSKSTFFILFLEAFYACPYLTVKTIWMRRQELFIKSKKSI